MNSWTVLGLDPATATERDVKSAYARLLKQHRPDQDPEGFQRIRQAYEQALGQLQRPARAREEEDLADEQPLSATRSTDSPQEDPWPLPRPPTAEPPAHSPEMQAVLRKLREAKNLGEIAGPELAALHEQALKDGLSPKRISALLMEVYADRFELLANSIPDQLTFYILRGGHTSFVHELINVWQEAMPPQKALRFTRHVQQFHRELTDPECAIVLARLGIVCGYFDSTLAADLANKAYPDLPAENKEIIMRQVDHEVQLGRLFHGFPAEMKTFWRKRMGRNDVDYNWSSDEAKAAIDYVMRVRGPAWPGCHVFLQILPDSMRDGFAHELQIKANDTNRQVQSMGGKRVPFWAVLMLLATLARIIVGLSGLSSSSSNYQPRNQDYQQYLNRDVFRYQSTPTAPNASEQLLGIKPGESLSPYALPSLNKPGTPAHEILRPRITRLGSSPELPQPAKPATPAKPDPGWGTIQLGKPQQPGNGLILPKDGQIFIPR